MGEAITAPTQSELLQILECPICQEFPIPPIYNCANGHFICNGCKRSLKNCALCEEKFTESRNYALESIISSTKFRCKYEDNGCMTPIKGKDLGLHISHCKFRPVICCVEGCLSDSVKLTEYVFHLKSMHGVKGRKFLENEKAAITIQQQYGTHFPPVYLDVPPNYFRKGATLILQTRQHKQNLYWWMNLIETLECTDREITVILTLSKETSPRCQMQWKLPVHSIRKPFDDIMDTGYCAILLEEQIKLFTRDKSKWVIQVEVDFEIPSVDRENIVFITNSLSSNSTRIIAIVMFAIFFIVTLLMTGSYNYSFSEAEEVVVVDETSITQNILEHTNSFLNSVYNLYERFEHYGKKLM